MRAGDGAGGAALPVGGAGGALLVTGWFANSRGVVHDLQVEGEGSRSG